LKRSAWCHSLEEAQLKWPKDPLSWSSMMGQMPWPLYATFTH
jgi:hypothetical protein